MKKRATAWILVLTLVLALTACGSTPAPTAADTDASTDTDTAVIVTETDMATATDTDAATTETIEADTETVSDEPAALQQQVEIAEQQGTEPEKQQTNRVGENSVYNDMIAFQSVYPEGSPWDNHVFRNFNGGFFDIGAGCAAFTFMLSDAAFGTLPARMVYTLDGIRVGDIIRINNEYGGHSVIVLSVDSGGVTVAEANYHETVHWGRYIPYEEFDLDYVLTRYSE